MGRSTQSERENNSKAKWADETVEKDKTGNGAGLNVEMIEETKDSIDLKSSVKTKSESMPDVHHTMVTHTVKSESCIDEQKEENESVGQFCGERKIVDSENKKRTIGDKQSSLNKESDFSSVQQI